MNEEPQSEEEFEAWRKREIAANNFAFELLMPEEHFISIFSFL